MQHIYNLLALLLCLCQLSESVQRSQGLYMNQFAVHIPGGDTQADEIAAKHGFNNIGQIGALKGYYLFEHNHVHKRSVSHSQEHHEKLQNEPEVKWVEQQREKRRIKRDFSEFPAFSDFGSLFSPTEHHARGLQTPITFPDPLYKEEWYLNGGAKDGFDMNVDSVWARGYTGKGVVVSILDDGIQTNHPDLAANYDPAASTDINDNDNDPMPRDNGDNKHGTRCAGEVAAVAFNSYCGIGVAYNASIGGVRMLDGSVNDAVEARALSLNPDHIDIYSASWGPEDDGKTVDGPGPLARRAFINGVTTGRRGRGSIFVWASGNGGRHTDSCNCDGYTNSIFTLSISSATQGGYKPWYLEECSSTLATTYSSGTPGHDKSIATVDMDGKLRPDHICTVEHTGTSASAPLAAGLAALALQANPDLSWRDMQHIVVMTSNPRPLAKESGWVVNGVSRKVSHKFGYGLMDGEAMVNLAEQWTSVPPQHICKSLEMVEDRPIDPSYGSVLTTSVDASGCSGTVNEVRFVEHVQCKISLRFFPRGNLKIVLTSPSGTPSKLLLERPRDVVASNFDDWPFLSVHFWGENPRGRWTLQVINAGNRQVNQPGILRKWQLIFYGTSSNPVRLRDGRGQQQASFAFPSAPPAASFFPSSPGQDSFVSSAFRNLPNIFQAVGSSPQKSVADLNSKSPLAEQPSDELNELGPKCHESCDTCAGPSQDSCLTCARDHFYVTDLGVCLQHCPDGYYEDRESRSCIGCHGNCASCPDGPTVCSSCDHHLILHNNKCIMSCPKGTFETDDYRCSPCHESCETCVQGEPEACVTCPGGSLASGGRCPPFHGCPANCASCEVQEACVICDIGYELTNTQECARSNTSCRPGEVLGGEGCEPCKDGNNCTKCPPGLHLMNSTCLTACAYGFFSDAGWCRACAPECGQCLGDRADQCLACRPGFRLAAGACAKHCPSDSFPTPLGCSRCHHFCDSCSGEGPYACTSCAPGRFMDAATKLCSPCQLCNSTNQHQCCHCDPTTGRCHVPAAGKRRIPSDSGLGMVDDMVAEASELSSTTMQSSSPYSSITAAAITVCAAVILMFGLIFTVLQVRSRGPARGGYTKVPIHEIRYGYRETSLRRGYSTNLTTSSLLDEDEGCVTT